MLIFDWTTVKTHLIFSRSPVCLSVCLAICPLFVLASVTICCLPHLFVRPLVLPSIRLFICVSVSASVTIRPSVRASVRPSVFLRPSVRRSARLSVQEGTVDRVDVQVFLNFACCSTRSALQPPGGNQVDGLPPARHTGRLVLLGRLTATESYL